MPTGRLTNNSFVMYISNVSLYTCNNFTKINFIPTEGVILKVAKVCLHYNGTFELVTKLQVKISITKFEYRRNERKYCLALE